MIRTLGALAVLLAPLLSAAAPAAAGALPALVETPIYEQAVAQGKLPPIAQRLPQVPSVVDMAAENKEPGRSGGEIAWLVGRARDIRIMNTYSYARLVGYGTDFKLYPDILQSIDVEGEKTFTLHLRPGHRWSDGQPFTSDDFRFSWQDVELNKDLMPYGPDARLIVDGEMPKVEFPDAATVRYSWSKPNPEFLPGLAGATPLYIYAPAHYLKQFHKKYADAKALEALVRQSGTRNWVALYNLRSKLGDSANPDLPELEPWINTTRAPAERFVFVRNPYYHRIDSQGRQLPYLDRVIVNVAEGSLIPAKAGAGEADLQQRGLRFDNISFLKAGEESGQYKVRLWPTALGSEVALYPNMNCNDKDWRALNRDVRFRRALSLAINRDEINQVVFFGLARPSQNTVLPESPYYDAALATEWTQFDLDKANALLDEAGLGNKDSDGIRLMPNGRRLEVVVESTGERSIEADILQLIKDSWAKIGVALYTTQSQRDVFLQRVFSGDAVMSVWQGIDNALVTPTTVPSELAPVDQNWLQYPKWGQYVQTKGTAGERPDVDFAQRLMALYGEWQTTADDDRRSAIIREMIKIQADEVTSIGTVQGVMAPVVVKTRLHNVPKKAILSWDPGAHFGIYHPDTFWVDP
ncbi:MULTISPECIES: ABC transporter substrate-binding protein [Inquilinus]|uniref:Peptide/nickel transport system substrate-binding protein n=1 Tax=Inquilinus ginsengisoli TaxID=363840 RepID=A0ABU1JZE0_9PROT|nr:ABC transporter substrate-binding protein [Inquilinus ginsengisoli]MDR6293637.1 peptide/nickel transport system substrate-binding protein [Inquilinus ginsengisoli]